MSSAAAVDTPWRLWDTMKTFHASGLLSVTNVLGVWSQHGSSAALPEERRKKNIHAFNTYKSTLIEIGLSASRVSLDRIMKALEDEKCSFAQLQPLCKELSDRLVDETEDKEFFSLSPRESEFFKEPRRGWELAISRFPEIVDDVEEASKCLALSRYPASVFHSLQVVECGLIELGTFIKVADPKSGWTAISRALNKILEKERAQMSRFEKKHYAFLEQLYATVEGLKNAWRNKIGHVQGRLVVMTKEFSPEVSEEILYATRAFMRRLAEGVPARKAKAPGA